MLATLSLEHPAPIWDRVKGDLKTLFPQDVFQTWFEPIRCLEETHESVVLGVPSEFASIWIQDNYADLLTQKLQEASGRLMGFALQVADHPKPAMLQAPKRPVAARPKATQSGGSEDGIDTPLLNPRNTFQNFIVGPGNQMAHAACIAVANAPARAYNPLFIYGETGLGKTHLIQAVAHHVLSSQPKAKVAYISTEKFTNEFIRAIQENGLVKFRQRYRSVDVLLIDDIHFLSGKERIQEEFFHTFNELFESQKQILLTSDRPASEIAKLENRLVSRFQWGLVTDVQPPDYETRLAILANKAAAFNLSLSPEILQFLAESVCKNVRRMEEALTRVAGYAALTQGELSIESLERLLHDILEDHSRNQITIERIQSKVVEYYHLKASDMMSKRRPANIAFPRQVAMYLSRMLTTHSLQDIGEAFGGRDHGTVIHACKAVENMIDQDATIKRAVEFLQKQLSKNI
ncbi:MAG: chromosomal replication initiator DnaA [Verrucomicrobia bacterium 21-51-4]|nr:MAG: chromosomal replication initiator DnaA [Verrucomicrobia bacterium 21-51-4]HQU08408.1 chromosomal replication initiator protein DnaA [Opitutales bacterium]